jgi:hypothetical protein
MNHGGEVSEGIRIQRSVLDETAFDEVQYVAAEVVFCFV